MCLLKESATTLKKLDAFNVKLKSFRIPAHQVVYHEQYEKVPPKGEDEHLVIVTDDTFMDEVLKGEESNAERFFIFSISEAAKAHKKTNEKIKEVTNVIEKLFAARNWDFQYIVKK